MSLTRTKILAYLKERWVKPDALQLAFQVDAPILGLLPKDESMGGKYMRLPMIRVGAQGRSATYATAKTNAAGTEAVAFEVTYVNNFQIAKIDDDVIRDTKGDDNALEEAVELEMDAVIANMKKDLQLGCFGNVGGARGRVGSITSGLAGSDCRIVLTEASDAKFFEEGMRICASDNNGTANAHALRDSGDAITITAIDRVNGYLEFAADVNGASGISGLTTNDYLFAEGDFKSKWAGFGSWIPSSDPSSGDSFYGVDRTDDVQRLSGIRKDCSALSLEDGFMDTAALLGLYGVKPDLGVTNPLRWNKLAQSIGADAQNRRLKVSGDDARVGYEAIAVVTERGTIPVVSDAGCGINEGFLLTTDSWKIGSVGKMVDIVDEDELTLRRGDGDNWLIEFKSRANMGCKMPGKNARLTFASM